MTEGKDFFYKRRYEAFLESTRGWPWQLAAFYSILLDVLYRFGGKLPDDIATIRTWIGADLSVYQWTKFRGELMAKGKLFLDAENNLRNPKADELIASRKAERGEPYSQGTNQEALEQVSKRSSKPFEKKNTKVRGDLFNENNETDAKTGQKTGENATVPARVRESQSQSKTRLESSTTFRADAADVMVQVQKIADALEQDRGRYWEQDFRRMIDAEGLTFADIHQAAIVHKSRGGEILRSITALRGLARAKRTERMATPSSPAMPSLPALDSIPTEDWKTALIKLTQLGLWLNTRFGDMPGTPDYRGPADLEQAFLVVWHRQGCHPLQEIDRNQYVRDWPADDPCPVRRAQWSRIP